MLDNGDKFSSFGRPTSTSKNSTKTPCLTRHETLFLLRHIQRHNIQHKHTISSLLLPNAEDLKFFSPSTLIHQSLTFTVDASTASSGGVIVYLF